MKNKKTIYIHAGTPKTGTSSIQTFLYENRDVLKKKDILYPFSKALFIDKNINIRYTPINLRPLIRKIQRISYADKEIKAFLKENTQYFYLEEIKKSEQSRIILSTEDFTYTSFELNVLKVLVRHLKELDFDIKIIIYLRRPADFVSSLWQQGVKDMEYLDDFLDSLNSINFNAVFSIPSLIEEFGVENVMIKPFDKAQFKNQNLIADFLDIFNLELDDNFKPLEKDVNVGFGRNRCQLFRMINLLKLSTKDVLLKARMMALPKEPKIVETLSDEEILHITNRYKDVYTKLANFYGKDSFFDTLLPSCYGKERPAYDSTTFSKEQMELIFEALGQAYSEKEDLLRNLNSKDSFIEKIFSAKNRRNPDGSKTKVITILGFKMRFKKRRKS